MNPELVGLLESVKEMAKRAALLMESRMVSA